uniref:RING-type domain-containing protein n=1 Tax=Erinnyis ello granulovirus TaxID=307444 RepID=A0A288WIJ6_9BBAC|nr:hypothetical protein EREL_023 [Erinnyis ello granulovirus]
MDYYENRHCLACETTYRLRIPWHTDPLAMMDCGHYYCRECILKTNTCYVCGLVTVNKFYVRHNSVWNVAPVVKKYVLPNTKMLSRELICLLVRFNNLTTLNFINHSCIVIDAPGLRTPHALLCPFRTANQVPLPSIASIPTTSNIVAPTSTKRVASPTLTIEPAKRGRYVDDLPATRQLQQLKQRSQMSPRYVVVQSDNNDSDDDDVISNSDDDVYDDNSDDEVYDDNSDDDVVSNDESIDVVSIDPPPSSEVKLLADRMRINKERLSRVRSISIATRLKLENFLAVNPAYDTNQLYQFCNEVKNNEFQYTLYDVYVVLRVFDVYDVCNRVDVEPKLIEFVESVKEVSAMLNYESRFIESLQSTDVSVNVHQHVVNLCDD